MAKGKTAAQEQDDGILDVLGIGGEPDAGEVKKAPDGEPSDADRITALLGSVEKLTGQVSQMQGDFTRALTGGAQAIPTPEAPQLKAITMDGLPNMEEDPEGFAKQLNTRMTETLQANMTALSAHQAAEQAATAATGARGDQLWSDFQDTYFDKLEANLPDTVSDVTPYVETAAKAVAVRAVRGIADPAQKARVLDNLMYGTPQRFMEDVFTEVSLVLDPLRTPVGEGEGGDGPSPSADDPGAHRTGGITGGPGGRPAPEGPDAGAEGGTMIADIQEIQRATGFF